MTAFPVPTAPVYIRPVAGARKHGYKQQSSERRASSTGHARLFSLRFVVPLMPRILAGDFGVSPTLLATSCVSLALFHLNFPY